MKKATLILLSFLALLNCNNSDNSTKNSNKLSNDSLTFFIASDLHFGKNEHTHSINKSIAKDMASLPDTFFPNSKIKVSKPQWVAITGDLTEHGTQTEWLAFTEIFGLNGTNKKFPFKVYEGFGNHDGPIKGNPISPVREGIKKRNLIREGIDEISDDSLHYSWNYNNIHFVNLNSYPGNKWDSNCEWCHYFNEGFREPSYSLNFLKKDLKTSVGTTDKPVVVFSHYGFDEWGNKWWTKDEQEAFYNTIKDYNIISIFHGHTHTLDAYKWKNIPVWSVGSTQYDSEIGEYMVVKITNDEIYIANRKNNQWGNVFKEKLLNH